MLPSIGVFGTDSHAQIIISLFKAAGFPVTAIWGQTEEKAKSLANELNIAFPTTKIDELLLHNEVDIVCVSGTPHQYAQVCVKALSIGKHVFSSVPAGLSINDSNDMLRAAQYYPKLLSVLNHPLRFLNAYIKARDLLATGYCGDLLLVECSIHASSLLNKNYDWYCDASMGGGILQRYGSHIVDVITFLINKNATEVQGTVETFVKQRENMPSFRHISSDDFCNFQLNYPGGVRACVTLNSHLPSGFLQEVVLVGTKGFLKIVNCDLYGQVKGGEDDIPTCLHREDVNNLYSDTVPGMYLQGLKHLIEGVKLAFESTQVAENNASGTDRRNADHNIIANAANFENGWNTRAVLDAIIESNERRAQVAVKQTCTDTNPPPFWSTKESLLHDSMVGDRRNLADAPTSVKQRASPSVAKRSK